MVYTRNELKEYIEADRVANHVGRYYLLKLLYGNERARVFRYLKLLRKYEFSINSHSCLRFWYRYRERRIGLKYGIFIVPNVVGKGLYISHLQGGVIVNCFSMGNNCIIAGGVVVGNKGSQDNRAIIGNNVELTLGCKVIGKVCIGDNSIVAPNSVVIKDVPANAVVSGVPALIIKLEGKSKVYESIAD